MNIILRRNLYTPWGVDGQLLINHQEVCDTIEHPYDHLPEGFYRIEIRHDSRLHRKVPVIMTPDAHHHHFPIIGIGNGPFLLTDGSINIGHRYIAGVVQQSSETFARLIDRLDKVANRGESITITII